MKREVKCYRCGKIFAAEESVRSDICPACMSFIDLGRAKEAYAEERKNSRPGAHGIAANPADAGREKTPQSAAPAKDSLSENAAVNRTGPSVRESPKAPHAETERDRENLMRRAQEALEEGRWEDSAALWEESLAIAEDWRAHFGIVLAETRDLSDFSCFAKVKNHADKALERADALRRAALAAAYLPRLNRLRTELSQKADALRAAAAESPERKIRQDRESGKKGYRAAGAVCIVFAALAFVILVAALSTGAPVGVYAVSVPLIIFSAVLAVVFLAAYSRIGKKQPESMAFTFGEDGKSGEIAALEEQIDAIDFICGSIKY